MNFSDERNEKPQHQRLRDYKWWFRVSLYIATNVAIHLLLPPLGPILAVIFFHDKINGVKFIALMLAIWGFLSYIYQHYLDDKKAKANKTHLPHVSRGEVEIC